MDDLDDMLARLNTRAPAPPEALMARVLADAAAVQPRRDVRPAAAPPALPARGGLWSALLGALGGAPAVAGLASAAVAGLAIGLAAPPPAEALTMALWGGGTDAALDLIPGFDEVLTDDGG